MSHANRAGVRIPRRLLEYTMVQLCHSVALAQGAEEWDLMHNLQRLSAEFTARIANAQKFRSVSK